MQTTEIMPDALQRVVARVPPGRPIFMVNLLRYNAQADYGDRADVAPCSGREAYFQRYVPAFGKVTEGAGIKAYWAGHALAAVVGPSDEAWDDVAVVEYPSIEAFRRMVESPEYGELADPHRRAALADWRLIATARMDLPG